MRCHKKSCFRILIAWIRKFKQIVLKVVRPDVAVWNSSNTHEFPTANYGWAVVDLRDSIALHWFGIVDWIWCPTNCYVLASMAMALLHWMNHCEHLDCPGCADILVWFDFVWVMAVDHWSVFRSYYCCYCVPYYYWMRDIWPAIPNAIAAAKRQMNDPHGTWAALGLLSPDVIRTHAQSYDPMVRRIHDDMIRMWFSVVYRSFSIWREHRRRWQRWRHFSH